MLLTIYLLTYNNNNKFVVMSYRFVLYTGHVTYYLLTYL